MKTLSLAGLCIALSFLFCKPATAQILCIYCYDQNDSISSGVNNLLLNGGFENNTCTPWPSGFSFYCPNSSYYSCSISNWTCTGGGLSTYACIFDNTYAMIPEGYEAAYFGNYFCSACSFNFDDTSCLNNVDCSTTGVPAGFPSNDISYGGTTGVSLEQTVSGLVAGNTYVLEFWAGGEWDFLNEGLFAVDVGFGDTMLRCKPTEVGAIGNVYLIQFNATSSSHTIKFTNWGHICSSCTELVLDNVRLYTVAELSDSILSCSTSSSPIAFTASDTDVCEKFCVSYFDSSANNPTAWQWIFEGGNPPTSTNQNPANICYNAPGNYDVTLITTNANGNDTVTLNDYITVYATPPFPTITQVGYTLTSSPAISYQWQLNSVNIPGATDQSYTVLQTGYYTVIVGDSNGCKNSFTQYVLISGIGNTESDANIAIYPNPSSGNFMVEFFANGAGNRSLEIDVTNTLGQKVFSSFDNIPSSDWKKEVDLRRNGGQYTGPGVYYIGIRTENVYITKKIFVIQ